MPLLASTLASTVAELGPGPEAYDTFDIPTDLILLGDHILAAEIHQVSPTSSDAVYGLELHLDIPSEILPSLSEPLLHIAREGDLVDVSWWGVPGFVLEEAETLSDTPIVWTPVSTPTNPYRVSTSEAPKFYRLRGL